MLTILHGENIVASRNKMVELIAQAKATNKTVERLEAPQLNPGFLESKMVKQDLFGTQQIIIIQELHSLPRSKQKTTLIELVAKNNIEVILWEKRKLTPTMLKKFPRAKVLKFPLSNALFSWLDSLNGRQKNKKAQLETFHAVLKNEDPYLCMIMLARQIKFLITAKEGGKISGAPWMAQKIIRQSQNFSLKQLLSIHQRLFTIDIKQKSSHKLLELEQELDLLLLSM